MKRETRIFFIVLMIGAISYLHYTTKAHHELLHLIHRELYLLPIVLGAYWFGRKGGLIISGIATLLFLPWTVMTTPGETIYHINNVLQVLMFVVVAYLVGTYRDLKVSHLIAAYEIRAHEYEKPLPEHGRDVLLCIDNSPNVLRAAKFLADSFASCEETTVTLLGIIREPSRDIFDKAEDWETAKAENESNIKELLEKARLVLIDGGIREASVRSNSIRILKESVAEKIIEEQQRLHYDLVVVGGVKMSKANEFLFGSLPVKLVREASFPVITVN